MLVKFTITVGDRVLLGSPNWFKNLIEELWEVYRVNVVEIHDIYRYYDLEEPKETCLKLSGSLREFLDFYANWKKGETKNVIDMKLGW